MSKFLGDKYKFYKEYLKKKLDSKSDEKIMTLEEFYHDKEIVREPIFEYNCLRLNNKPSGCPVCPICKEPTYDLECCAFCGQRLEKECNLWEVDEYAKDKKENEDNRQVYCTDCINFRTCDEELPCCMYENKCDINDCEDSRPFKDRPYYKKA